jgi:hypothetical protein
VWLALAVSSNANHAKAKAWYLQHYEEVCCYCRLTQQAFLRLVTKPKVLRDDTMTMSQAWTVYEAMTNNPWVSFHGEPEGLDPIWKLHTVDYRFSQNVWSDAYLAAFAQAAGLHIVTCDTGFRQYDGFDCTILV